MIFLNRIIYRNSGILKTCLLLLIVTLSWASTAFSQAPQDTLLLNSHGSYPLNQHFYYYSTPKVLTPDEVYHHIPQADFKKLYPEEAINSGFSNDHYWMVFTLKNPLAANKELFLQFNNPYLNTIKVFEKTATGFVAVAHMGATLPFYTRPYTYQDFVLPLHVPANQSRTWILMTERKGEIFSMKPELIDTKTFKVREQRLYIIFGIIVGIMIFNIIVNVFLGLSSKDRIHYLYALYVLANIVWLFSSVGLDFQFIYPNTPALLPIAQSVAGGIDMVLMAQLAIVFLRLHEGKSRVKLFLNIGKYIVLLQIPLWFIIYHYFHEVAWLKQTQNLVYLFAIFSIAICIIAAAIEKIRMGYKPAWFYLAAVLYLAFGVVRTCVVVLGGLDTSELVTPPTAVQQGLVLESIIIFIGIMNRSNIYKKEREKLQLKLQEQHIDMMQQVVAAQEEERKRLAQDLHDDVGATLSILLLHITNIPDTPEWKTPFAINYTGRSMDISQKALSDLRSISHDLVPKDFALLGLFHVINNRIDDLNQAGDIRFGVNTVGDDKMISDILSITLYRIINEFIINIVKHSMAAKATIDISINATNVMLMIDDDGIGLNMANNNNGIGLKNIQSRIDFLSGIIHIDSNKKGTTVIVDIPLNPVQHD